MPTKLTEDQIALVPKYYDEKLSIKEIAEKFGVSYHTIYFILFPAQKNTRQYDKSKYKESQRLYQKKLRDKKKLLSDAEKEKKVKVKLFRRTDVQGNEVPRKAQLALDKLSGWLDTQDVFIHRDDVKTKIVELRNKV